MTVEFIDKRPSKIRIAQVGIGNGLWFSCLDFDGMDKLVNTQHTNDEINATPVKARKIAEIITKNKQKLIECGFQEMAIDSLVEFLINCNGFRTY